MPVTSRTHWVCAALLVLAVTVPHFWFSQHEWVYDDLAIVGRNRVVQQANFRAIWTTPYWSGVTSVYQKDNLHRPLFLSLAALLRQHPNGLRCCVLLSHLMTGLLVALCALSIARSWRGVSESIAAWVALGTAAFFLVQPAQVEVTAQAIGLLETMPCLLGILALLVLPRRPWLAVAIVASAAGWKETGYIWLAVVAGSLAWRKRLGPAVVTVMVTAAWLTLRFWVYGNLFQSADTPFALLNPLVTMGTRDAWFTRVSLLGHYLRLVILPWDLSCDYSLGTLPVPGYLLQVWFLLGAAFLAALLYQRKTLLRANQVLLWGPLLTILPVLHLASPAGVIFAERFGYAFTVGTILCLLVVFGPLMLKAQPKTQKVLLLALAFLSLGDYMRMVARHRDWMSAETLFSHDVRNYPYNAKLRYNYAVALGAQQRWQGALESLLAAVTLEPNFPDAHYRLALVYRQLKDEPNAKLHWDIAAKLGNTLASGPMQQ